MLRKTQTDELAVMVDTFKPLDHRRDLEDRRREVQSRGWSELGRVGSKSPLFEKQPTTEENSTNRSDEQVQVL